MNEQIDLGAKLQELKAELEVLKQQLNEGGNCAEISKKVNEKVEELKALLGE